MLKYGIKVEVRDCSINYQVGFKPQYAWVLGVLYLALTTLPHMISSLSKVWILGALNVIIYTISKIYYYEHVISVWCFLAAISSLAILWIITSSKTGEKQVVEL